VPRPLERVLTDSECSRAAREDLNTILAKTLEKDRSRRYSSAAALADDIVRFLSDRPITARPPSAWYLARKFARRHRLLVVCAVALLATCGLGTIGTLYGLVRARAAVSEKERVLDDAIDAVSSIAGDVIPSLGSTAGTTQPNRVLLEQLLKLYDTLH